jgi:hypothetical protein
MHLMPKTLMFRVVARLNLSSVLVRSIASLSLSAWAGVATADLQSRAGPVIGAIEYVRYETDQYYVFGWACQQGNGDSIDVHIYAGHAADATPGGTFATAGRADLDNEPAIDRACQNANRGKHRFKIALPNQLLRAFQKKDLFAHGIAVTGNVENAAIAGSGKLQFPSPKWPPDPPTPDFFDGPPVAAFDTQKDSCELIDIPDAAARAYRDYRGTIHLIASHYVARAGLGATLETAKHNCQVIYRSRHEGNPAEFDDYNWLTQFYSIDGKQIVALGHMEYHGWEHPGMCASQTETVSCWYNADTSLISNDGGYSFTSSKPPSNYLLGLPYRYQPNQGPEGYSVDTNILMVGGWYYATAFSWAWPPNCGQSEGQPPCLVPDGACPIRTANILDPSSWRGWDGKAFTVVFVDPYQRPVANPQAHVCAPVQYLDYANGANFHEVSRLFVATLWNQGSGGFGPPGVYFTTSADFVHWSDPVLAVTLNQMLRREPEGNWSFMYFSLIDPASTDSSFSTITDHPYLYYVRLDDSHGPYQRVLFRQRVKLDWLFRTAVDDPAIRRTAPPPD